MCLLSSMHFTIYGWLLTTTLVLLLSVVNDAFVPEFDAFDRKMFKKLKQRYAYFDQQGILTLDASLNGKSNDITFTHSGGEEQRQTPREELCRKEEKLAFELCEMQKLRAWTRIAICYESQLAMAALNPFYRLRPDSAYAQLVNDLCGPRQNAIFVDRLGVYSAPNGSLYLENTNNAAVSANGGGDGACSKYEPYYALWTSFATEKYYFSMPDKKTEKQCVLIKFGGQNITNFNITSLRREPRPIYVAVGTQLVKKELVSSSNLPEMANLDRPYSERQHIDFLLLDFSPKYGLVQNISMYGWMPVEIKIVGQTLSPCMLKWEFIKSREVRGPQEMKAQRVVLEYMMQLGAQQSKQAQQKRHGSATRQFSGSADAKAGFAAGKGGQEGGNSGNIGGSYSNTWGASLEVSNFALTTQQMATWETKDRTEKVSFFDVHGKITVEQLVFECDGTVINTNRIRYSDPLVGEVAPDEVGEDGPSSAIADYAAQAAAEAANIVNPPEDCMDEAEQCPIWASQGQCRNENGMVYMLTRCKKSCGVCKLVGVKPKERPSP